MEQGAAPVAEIFRLNTDLLLNCIAGVSEAPAATRVLPDTNSMAFVTAHLVDARHFALKLLDRPVANPLVDLPGHATGDREADGMPSLAELRGFWRAVSKHLEGSLESASAELLRTPSPQKFPVQDASLLAGLAFLAQHESYHVGQLALMRKGLGYPAMGYTRSSDADS